MNNEAYAKIIIDISHEAVDRPFTYRIPDHLRGLLSVGSRVEVPFGRGNSIKKGFVMEFADTTDVPSDKLKDIIGVNDRDISLSDSRIRLACWLKRNYGSTMSAALKTVLPVKTKINPTIKKTVVRLVEESEIDPLIEEALKKRNVAQLRFLYAIRDEREIPKSLLDQKLHISAKTIDKYKAAGVIEVKEERLLRSEIHADRKKDVIPDLSDEQRLITDTLKADMDAGVYRTYLIHGITGSGKTEVYMRIIEDVLNRGRQAVMLIPEVALTYQTLMRFYRRFGDRVAVMNSTLSAGEKYDVYEQAAKGEVDIVIGPRSALFTPLPNIGVIIIDEEHEGSYKSETMPKYHARETAIEIARECKASVVLGSATPSVDSYYKAVNGEYKLFTLTKRLTGNQLPDVEAVDLRAELKAGNRSIFSRRLKELMEDRLSKGEQAMLFLNRRGLAGFVSCRACGFVVKCPHCDVSLSLHANGSMVCHYCGYQTTRLSKCPECGSKYIAAFKAGTEQVEAEVKRMFPAARVLRMDADTTAKKGEYESILSKFADHEADILIGTQMIVKGHDFKDVTLVGVLAADMSLFQSDYRASERTFQLLTQAAGRAGRGDNSGSVVIQTYKPDHYAVQYSLSHDYEGFFKEEADYRRMMDYPPASHLFSVLVTSKEEILAEELAKTLANEARKVSSSPVFGPAKAMIGKIEDRYRFTFYVKNADYDELVKVKDRLEELLSKRTDFSESVFFDFDPQTSV